MIMIKKDEEIKKEPEKCIKQLSPLQKLFAVKAFIESVKKSCKIMGEDWKYKEKLYVFHDCSIYVFKDETHYLFSSEEPFLRRFSENEDIVIAYLTNKQSFQSFPQS